MSQNEQSIKGPFDGLLVVSIEQAVAAPLCSGKLAEGGARVIKIERSEGDFARKYDSVVKGESAYFIWANQGKESLVLNFKESQDADLLHKILSTADVFIQNLAPGAMQRAGFGSEELRQKYPRLITCDISGYGEQGAYRDMKAYDFLVQCESGLVSINGSPQAYGRIGVSVCDIGAGMNAMMGIQNALLLRARTNQGSGVKVSLFDTAADWMTVPYLHCKYGGKSPQRVGLHHPSIAPYGGYTTQDGQILAISVQNEREWAAFCIKVLAKPELVEDERFSNMNSRVENRQALDEYINQLFHRKTRLEMEKMLRDAAIAFGAVNLVEDLIKHPQLRTRKVELESGQQANLLASPIQYSYDEHYGEMGKVPSLGQHTHRIKKEFAVNIEQDNQG